MLKEFREFAIRGNVMDLAVAVIIGAAFGKIVTSLVDNILMPLIGLVMGGIDFSALTFQVGDAVIEWGLFVQSIIDFIIIAFVIFLIVRAINRLKRGTSNTHDKGMSTLFHDHSTQSRPLPELHLAALAAQFSGRVSTVGRPAFLFSYGISR